MTDCGCRDEQDSEAEALEAIYGEDYEDCRRSDVWNVWRPLDVRLRLRPLVGDGLGHQQHVGATLRVRCGVKYPGESPQVSIEDSKGLSNQKLDELLCSLIDAVTKLKGKVMIYDLAQVVMEFLAENNKAPSGSFYDAMMAQKAKEEEARTKCEQDREKQSKEIERQVTLEEQARKEEALRRSSLVNREEIAAVESPANGWLREKTTGTTTVNTLTFGWTRPKEKQRRDGRDCDDEAHRGTTTVELTKAKRRFRRSHCISHDDDDDAVLDGDTAIHPRRYRVSHFIAIDEDTGDPAYVTQWDLSCGKSMLMDDESQAMKELHRLMGGFENDVVQATRIRDAIRLVPFLGTDVCLVSTSSATKALRISTIEGLVPGTTAAWHISQHWPADYAQLRQYAVGVLEALAYLHENNVVHRNLRDTHIHVDRRGQVRLSGFVVTHRVHELLEECVAALTKPMPDVENGGGDDDNGAGGGGGGGGGDDCYYNDDDNNVSAAVSRAWTWTGTGVMLFDGVRRRYPPYVGRSGKKADVHRVGVVLLSLRMGRIVSATFPAFPEDLNPDFRHFLDMCMKKDEKSRWTASELLEHPFLKSPSALPSLVSLVSRAGDSVLKPERDDKDVQKGVSGALPVGGATDPRLQNDFQVLGGIGSGGFGQVIKARNKIDGNLYAIKIIKLNTKSKHLNRKVRKEVELLSKLNHENVVRYYNSWIEETYVERKPRSREEIQTDEETSASSLASSSTKSKKDASEESESFMSDNHSEESVEEEDDDEDEDDDDEEDDVEGNDEDFGFGTSRSLLGVEKDEDSSTSDGGVVFEAEDANHNNNNEKNHKENGKEDCVNGTWKKPRGPGPCLEQYLYIQMEFCDKNTLRHAIDGGLYLDMQRVWRLFRQVVLGLDHIHQQGMIHRDLKPINVFLDHRDNVKIGDFGLATVNAVAESGAELPPRLAQVVTPNPEGSSENGSNNNDMTMHIGTHFYVAPEVAGGVGRRAGGSGYDQKVDIYSLGIMFFEMCSPPPTTQAERAKILTDLRNERIILPDWFQFPSVVSPSPIVLIRRLLSHCPSERPSSSELLKSNLLPPPQVEEARLREMVASALNDPTSTAFKDIVTLCFHQEMNTTARTTAVTFELEDATMRRRGSSTASATTTALSSSAVMQQELAVRDWIRDVLVSTFRLHGASSLGAMLLAPRMDSTTTTTTAAATSSSSSVVTMMDRAGVLVELPHDLRTPFVRHVVRHDMTRLKRYVLGKVYRKQKVFGVHPRELEECDFDIVSPPGCGLLADAEVVFATWQALSALHRDPLESSSPRRWAIHVNHAALTLAVLVKHGVRDGKHEDILALVENMRNASRRTLVEALMNIGLSDSTAESVCNMLRPVEPHRLDVLLKSFGNNKDALKLAKLALSSIKTVVSYAEAMGVKFPVTVMPSMLQRRQDFSGVMFQFLCQSWPGSGKGPKAKAAAGQPAWSIVAAGGRYTALIHRMRLAFEPLKGPIVEPVPDGVGVSISVDKLLSMAGPLPALAPRVAPAGVDAVICAVGGSSISSSSGSQPNRSSDDDGLPRKMLEVACGLWAQGTRVDIHYDVTKDLEALQQACLESGVPCLLVLKRNEEPALRVNNGRKYVEKRVQEPKSIYDAVNEALYSWNQMSGGASGVGGGSGGGGGGGTSGGPSTAGGGDSSYPYAVASSSFPSSVSIGPGISAGGGGGVSGITSGNVGTSEGTSFGSKGRSESMSRVGDGGNNPSLSERSHAGSNLSIHFIFGDKKPKTFVKKVAENHISAKIASVLEKLNPRIKNVHCLGLDVRKDVLDTLVTQLGMFCSADESQIRLAFHNVADRHQRFRKVLSDVLSKFVDVKQERKPGVVIVYSIPDDVFRVFL